MPSDTSPATAASAISIWVFSVQKAEIVKRKKELVTVEVAMVSRCSEVDFPFQSAHQKKCRTFMVITAIPTYVMDFHIHQNQAYVIYWP